MKTKIRKKYKQTGKVIYFIYDNMVIIPRVILKRFRKIIISCILGNPGATSRDDAIFSGESLLEELKSPWELILTELVPEVVEFRPADWAEKYFFCPISNEV